MSAGTVIVQNALKKIGVHSIASPADSETIVDAVNSLNSMLQRWESLGIELGTGPLDVPGDELGEPLDTTVAIEDNLALLMAPYFDNAKSKVSRQLKINADLGFEAVKDSYRTLTIPEKVVSSTCPKGEGNSEGTHSDFFFEKDGKISN